MAVRIRGVMEGYIHGSMTSPTELFVGEVLKQFIAKRGEWIPSWIQRSRSSGEG